MDLLNEKLQFSLQKYSVESDMVLQDKDTVRVGGKMLPPCWRTAVNAALPN